MGLVYKSLEGPQELPAFEVSSGIRFIKAEFLDFSLEKVKRIVFYNTQYDICTKKKKNKCEYYYNKCGQ